MHTSTSLRWLVVAVSAAMLLVAVAACGAETVEVPGETVVVEKEVIKEVQVPGETVVVKEEVVKTVEVPGETVVKEVVKEVQIPGETVVVEKEVVKLVEVPGETVVVEKEVVKTVVAPVETSRYTRNVHGKVVDAPQYGGKISIPHTGAGAVDVGGYPTDPMYDGATWNVGLVLENLGGPNWGIPREEYPFHIEFVPMEYAQGMLAESWTEPDPNTIIFNIRKGVNWHNKAPMNGREFNAYDVEYTWHRLLGIPDKYGFTVPNGGWLIPTEIESVTATDEWTVEFKTSTFSFNTLQRVAANRWLYATHPREVIEQYGDMKDWKTLVGTGPYELVDVVEGSSATYTKIPDYWKNDENFPENRLPYLDEIDILIMPDFSTRITALRTGQTAIFWGEAFPPDSILSLQKTNPELVVHSTPGPFQQGAVLNSGRPPFDDIRVRQAMQKALDNETINETYYKGLGESQPWGKTGPGLKGFYLPHSEWPEELKEGYRYDPVEAERLLDEAGYERGSDGIRFKVSRAISVDWGEDVDLFQILKAYWAQIGVDVELNLLDGAGMLQTYQANEYDMFRSEFKGGEIYPVSMLNAFRSDASWKPNRVTDSTFDALWHKANGATNMEDFGQWSIDLDMYVVSQYWIVQGPSIGRYPFTQPWLNGYNGEYPINYNTLSFVRTWVDQEMKSAMGH